MQSKTQVHQVMDRLSQVAASELCATRMRNAVAFTNDSYQNQVCNDSVFTMIHNGRRIWLAPSLGRRPRRGASCCALFGRGCWWSGAGWQLTEGPTHFKLRPPGACTQKMDACRGEALCARGSCAHDTPLASQQASQPPARPSTQKQAHGGGRAADAICQASRGGCGALTGGPLPAVG